MSRIMKLELWQNQFDSKMKRFERRLQEAEQNFEDQINKIKQTLNLSDRRRGGILLATPDSRQSETRSENFYELSPTRKCN